ncbi:unannotated protein [freshwater metagenome]|uniref:Unannotated protein n=1 Tax=freshwater metagenome TaxID=449393 RepID=A0A6J7L312_9ZZZZ|nr:hypothetical protein [Actinomycetota bacterium]
MSTQHELLAKAVERAARTAAAAYGSEWSALDDEERARYRALSRRWAEFLGLDAAIGALSTIATKTPVEADGAIAIRTIDGDDAQVVAEETLAGLIHDDTDEA